MANVIGSGSTFYACWPAATAPTVAANLVFASLAGAEPAPEEDARSRWSDLLDRAVEVLAPHPMGLPLATLREALGVDAASARSALEHGLRARKVRRVGAGSTLRYVSNPQG
jgi:hypothetical protein